MAIDYSGFAFPKTSSTLDRTSRSAARETALRKAYGKVDARDGKRCQVTDIPLVPRSTDAKRVLTRNHLKPRSTAPDERDDPDNILTVSKFVHDLMQSSALIAIDAKGHKTTRVSRIAGFAWNRRMVRPGKEPFRLER